MGAILFFSFIGAVFQEILFWYSLREKLELKKYQNLVQSRFYWTITTLMIFLTPVVTYALVNGNERTPLSVVLIVGAGAPLIVKKGIELYVAAMKPTVLGDEKAQNDGAERSNAVSAYFGLS